MDTKKTYIPTGKGNFIDVEYEKEVTKPFTQLIRGREYSVDGIDMIYHGSTGNNNGENENAEYNFRTPATVTPFISITITKKNFNKHRIIQTNQDVKALQDAQNIFELDEKFNKTKKEDYNKTGWLPNGGLPTEDEEQKLHEAISALQIAKQQMGSPKKKAGKRKSLKKKRKTKKRKWSFKYKRRINCKKPKGFSQKQYCKRKNKKHLTRRKK